MPRRRRGRFVGSLIATVLLLVAGLTGEPVGAASALSFPWSQNPAGPLPGLERAPGSRLQEVAPPPAVLQLQQALADRQPRVEILSPAADSLLAAGPWTLRLKVEDWPLVDAGPLGLGPHLVVQLDGDPPRRLTETEVPMPPLRPGSHLLTVYAARPWGEAVKSPGAFRQVRLHRAAANPLTLPAAGTPQLIAVGPTGHIAAEPLQLDWLLLDAPLQHLRSDDAGWRLRITINGDGFLIDRQTPLWLNGWRSGANTLQMELVDARGEPLNPPFNSLVSEVTLDPGAQRPRWQEGPLQPDDLARLLSLPLPPGQPQPLPQPQPPDSPLPAPAADVGTGSPTPGQPETGPKPEAQTETQTEAEAQTEVEAEPEAAAAEDPATVPGDTFAAPELARPADRPPQPGEPLPKAVAPASPEASQSESVSGEAVPSGAVPNEAATTAKNPASERQAEPEPEGPRQGAPAAGDQESEPASPSFPGERPAIAEAPAPLEPGGESVPSDGTAIRPRPSGFLSGLRERFGR